MAARDEMSLEIWRDRVPIAACPGPDETGNCSVSAPSVKPVCAGAELLVRSEPEDCWYFTVPPAARGCPLAWLVSKEGQPKPDGFYGGRVRGGRRTRLLGQ